MPRPGVSVGVDQNTKLWMPWLDGALADRSGQGGAVTARTGTGSAITSLRPYLTDGPFGHAVAFGASADRVGHVAVAQAGAIDVSGGLTAECWARPRVLTSELPLFSRISEGAGTSSAWDLRVSPRSATARVWNSSGTLDTLTLDVLLGRYSVATRRWAHWRMVFSPSAGIYLFVDGQLWAYKTTALANLRDTTLGSLYVGAARYDGATIAQFEGDIAEPRLRSAADVDLETSPASLRPERAGRRLTQVAHLDVGEHLQADSWTADGAGGYYRALSGITIGAFIACPQDVVSVKAKTLSSGVTTTVTFDEYGNVAALDAAANGWFLDLINSRLYVSEDPSTYTVLELTVRVPLASRGARRGFRWYRGVIASLDLGERAVAFLDEPSPTSGGATLRLAAAYSGWPTGLTREEATSVVFAGSRLFCGILGDGQAWQHMTPAFAGIVDAEPTEDRDHIDLRAHHELIRLHRVPLEQQTTDAATYPYVYQRDEGKTPHTVVGIGLLRVPCYCIDSRPTTKSGVGNCYQYKFSNVPVASILAVYSGGSKLNIALCEVDLSAGTFWMAAYPGGQYSVDVDGLATPTTSTFAGPTVPPIGTRTDACRVVKTILQKWLSLLFATTSSDYGSSWTGTDSRAQVYLRTSQPLSSASALVDYLQRTALASLTFPYARPSTEKQPALWELKDVVKADAAAATLTDGDVLEDELVPIRDRMAARLIVDALAYWFEQGALKETKSTSLTLKTEAKYRDVIQAVRDFGRLGHMTTADADAWLAKVRALKEAPLYKYRAVVSARWLGREQMDKVTVSTSKIASAGVATAFRVQSVRPMADGTVELLMFPEAPLPADGTSAAPTRSVLGPSKRFSIFTDGGGTTCVTQGAWTRVGYDIAPMQGGFGPFNSGGYTSHSILFRAKRNGGADGDFQLRVRDRRSGLVIATKSSGIGTTAAAVFATTLANIPANDADLEVQYYAQNGATGDFYEAKWHSKETAGVGILDQLPASLWWSWGYAPGVRMNGASDDAGGFWYFMYSGPPIWVVKDKARSGGSGTNEPFVGTMSLNTLPAGTYKRARAVVHADGTGTSGLKVGFILNVDIAAELYGRFGTAYYLQEKWVSITGGDAYYASEPMPFTAIYTIPWLLAFTATTYSASARLYSVGIETVPPDPVF